MKDFKIYVLIIGILVAGIAFNSVAQSKNKQGEKQFYHRVHHEPKKAKSDFRNMKSAKAEAKANKHAKHYGKHQRKMHKTKAYARRKDEIQ